LRAAINTIGRGFIMKKVATLAVISLLSMGVSSQVAAGMPKYMEKQLVAVCHALKNDNKLALNKIIRKAHFDYAQIAKGLRCNGQSAHEFAMSYGAKDTADLIAKRGKLSVGQVIAKR